MTSYALNVCLLLLLVLALYRRFILRPQILDLERRVKLPEFQGTARLQLLRYSLNRLTHLRARLRWTMLALATWALFLLFSGRAFGSPETGGHPVFCLRQPQAELAQQRAGLESALRGWWLGSRPEDFRAELRSLTGRAPDELLISDPPPGVRLAHLTQEEKEWLRRLYEGPRLTDEGSLLLLRLVRRGGEVFEELFETTGLRERIEKRRHGGTKASLQTSYQLERRKWMAAFVQGRLDGELPYRDGMAGEGRQGLAAQIEQGERARALFLQGNLWRAGEILRRPHNGGYLRGLRRRGHDPLELFSEVGEEGIGLAMETFREEQGEISRWVQQKIEWALQDYYRRALMEKRGVPRSKLRQSRDPLSLSYRVEKEDWRPVELWQTIPDPSSGIGFDREAKWAQERTALLEELLASLPARERAMVRAHYLEGKTVDEIGRDQGLDKTSVSLLVSKAVASMRHHPEGISRIAPHLPRLRPVDQESFEILSHGVPVAAVTRRGTQVRILDGERLVRMVRFLGLSVLLDEIERELIRAALGKWPTRRAAASQLGVGLNRIERWERTLGPEHEEPAPAISSEAFPEELGTFSNGQRPRGMLGKLAAAISREAVQRAENHPVRAARWLGISKEGLNSLREQRRTEAEMQGVLPALSEAVQQEKVTAVLVDPQILEIPEAGLEQLLEGVGSALRRMDRMPVVFLHLLSEKAEQEWQGQAAVVKVVPASGKAALPGLLQVRLPAGRRLPVGALPFLVARAVAEGARGGWVDGAEYLGFEAVSLDQALEQFAAGLEGYA